MTSLILPLGQIGYMEIILLAALVLLLFGGKKIPELMRGVGRGVKEFKDAVNKDYTAESDSKDKSDKPKGEENQ